ncbi:hypothetical protein NDA10_004460 [Ustilago hordei]|nr:hypothetical protein NDA10_004460 [Ustilago hordei]
MTPRSGVSVDDDEVDGVSDEIGDVGDNEVDGVGDKVGGVNTSVQCVDLMLEVIPGPQWTTAFGSIYIRPLTCYGRLRTSGSGDTTHTLR